jgi:hypothetical protein
LGLPLALYLGFNRSLELRGFWLGFSIALVFLDIIVATIVIRSDWSIEKLEKDEKALEENKIDPVTKSLRLVRINSGFYETPFAAPHNHEFSYSELVSPGLGLKRKNSFFED